jgi:hypothetical protein
MLVVALSRIATDVLFGEGKRAGRTGKKREKEIVLVTPNLMAQWAAGQGRLEMEATSNGAFESWWYSTCWDIL